jgi:hypothetical protein
MFRRMEDKIRRLCSELSDATDHAEQVAKLGELRRELQLHIRSLRARLASYPIAQERRVLNGFPPPDTAIPVSAGPMPEIAIPPPELEKALETSSPAQVMEMTNSEPPTAITEPDSNNDKKIAS